MVRQSNEERAEQNFPNDVATHQLVIRLNNDLHRHLSFRRAGPNKWNLWFDIVTWPGFLCICGDMGTWTFARLADMFVFFRDSQLRINASYWAEKLQNGTSGGRSNAKEWDEEVFMRDMIEQLTGYYGLEGEKLASVQAEVERTISYESGNGPHAMYRAMHEFTFDGFEFESCELPDGMVYSYRFLWCLYAIVWGIQQFDAAVKLPASDVRETDGAKTADAPESKK